MKNSVHYFLDLGAVILFLASSINLLVALNPAPILGQPDTIFPLSHRLTLFGLGGIELSVSAFLLIRKNPWTKLALMAWLAGCLAFYRLALWSSGDAFFGDCIGNLYHWFALSPWLMAVISNVMIGILLAGSSFFLVRNWWLNRSYQKKLAAFRAQS